MQSTLKITFSSCKVPANSSNSPLPAIPDQSTNHIALAYRHAICLVISKRHLIEEILHDVNSCDGEYASEKVQAYLDDGCQRPYIAYSTLQHRVYMYLERCFIFI
jgi:hypothetical protein